MSPRAGWYLNVETNKMKYWDGDDWKKKDEDETPPAPVTSHKEVSHKAIVAFVLSLIFPLVGWLVGIRAQKEIRESNGTKTGSAYATAATWIGGIGTAIWVFIIAATLAMGGHHHGWGDDNHFGGHGMMGGSYSLSQSGSDNSGNDGFGMMGGMMGQDPTGQGLTNQDPNGGLASGNGGFGMMRQHGSLPGQSNQGGAPAPSRPAK